jgi:rubrerythrin
MSAPEIRTEAEFYGLVHALESEAAERYADLADQMAMHNNPRTAALFRRLAEIELRHAAAIRERAAASGFALEAMPLVGIGAIVAEQAPLDEAHYLMTPHHALTLALRNEEQAADFFVELERTAANAVVRRLAASAAAEEREHQERIRVWLADHPLPAQGWADDPDPPVYSE